MVDGVHGYVDHVVICDGTQQCSTSCDNPTGAVRIGMANALEFISIL